MKKASRTPATKLRPRADLLAVHSHGQQLLKKFPRDNARGAIKEEAKRLGITPTEFRKRVLFARIYKTQASLNQLLKLKPPKGKPKLSWAHVQKLLTVKIAEKRQGFAERANEKGWSVHILTCEIEGKLGVGYPGGRKPELPPTGLQKRGRPPNTRTLSPGTMREIQLEADQMLRLFDAFRDPDSGTLKSPASKDRRKCEKLLGEVVTRLKDLKDGLEKFTGELEHELRAQKTPKKNDATRTKTVQTNRAQPVKEK